MSDEFKIGKREVLIGCAIAVLFFFWLMWGFTGVKTIVGFVLIFIFPIYLILLNFDIEQEERFIFSLFLGIGIVPFIVFFANQVFTSLRVATLGSFVLLVCAGLIIRHFKSKYDNKSKKTSGG